MLDLFSQRVLPLLQLTRMALVFTALADSLCALLLLGQWRVVSGHSRSLWDGLGLPQIIAVAMISAGLYGFGMSLNDIIDRRRDRQLAAHRPLPSGRVGIVTAHVVCALLATAAVVGGIFYSMHSPAGWMSLALVVWTALLITFYDFAGKYLVAHGLLSLGLIRFFHATIPCPQLPLLWHPLLLLNHVTILSTVAYQWEEKRPRLTPLHWWGVLGGLGFVDVAATGLLWWRRHRPGNLVEGFISALWIEPQLLIPLAAAGLFVALAAGVRLRGATRREAGQTLMLYGLLWLIVYDATFVLGYVGWKPAVIVFALLPLAYCSVLIMRWWSRLVAISQRPGFKRAGV